MFFSASALCGHSPRGASENGRVRLGTSAACGPNRKGRSRNRGPPFLLQGCVFDRAERTAEKDGALFSRRATKSGCLRLLQVDPPLWDYNTIGWAGRVSNAPLPLLQLLRPRSGSRKQFVAKTFRPGGTLEDYYKAKGGGDGSALRHLLQSLLSGIRVQKTVCQKTRSQDPIWTHCLAHTATVPFLRVPQKWDRGSVR